MFNLKKIVSMVCVTALLGVNLLTGQQVYAKDSAAPAAEELNSDGNYLVKLKQEPNVNNFKDKNGLKNKKVKKLKSKLLSVQLNKNELENIKKDSEVDYIEKDSNVTISDSATGDDINNGSQTIPWGNHSIGADLINDSNKKGKNIKIAVLDTGISQHPDLSISGGVSYVDGTSDYHDDNGHGTHVSGTIAALDNNIGIEGVASQSLIYAVKVLDQNGSGSYSKVIEGIQWAIDNDIDIISMSFGGSENSQILHEALIEAKDKGIILVAAAGNKGIGEETEMSPALFPEVISVGAVTKSHKRSVFSSTGAEIDLVAPGTDILSTTNSGAYGELSGTSMSVPHVVGSAAAIWSDNPQLTSNEVVNKLYETATPLGEANQYGHGLINLAKAVGLTESPIEPYTNEDQQPSENTLPTLSDINKSDNLLFGYNKKLLDLKAKAKSEGNKPLAKKILQTYNDLLINNIELHELSDEVKSLSKDENVSQAMSDYYSHKETDFKKLEALYLNAIDLFNKQTKVESSEKDNQVTDTYEPNNNFEYAHTINPVNTYNSTISSSSDVDYYKFTSEKTGLVYVSLAVPTDKDYDFYVYNKDGYILSLGNTGAIGSAEGSFINVETEHTYYIGVQSHNLDFSDSAAYTLQLSNYILDPQILSLNNPIDVSLPQGYSVYQFTPNKSGNHKIFTGPYGGYGAANDTVLEVYTDAALTNQVASNDDSNGTTYSEINTSLISGFKYYIKIRNYRISDPLNARLMVQLDSPQISPISVFSPVDVTALAGESKIFKFSPPGFATYKIFTGNYGGEASTSVVNDTVLSAYLDPNLTQPISFNDDYNDSLFSQLLITTSLDLYIKVAGYDEGQLKARTTILPIEDPASELISLNTPVDTAKALGTNAYYHFTPDQSGVYRFYTSSYQNTGENNDTVLYLYDNATGHKLARNDDASEANSFSKIEYDLEAGKTYGIVIRNFSNWEYLRTRFQVESDINSDIDDAIPATWEEIYTDDLSSIYDVDYFKVEVTEPTSVHLNITSNKVTIEDIVGNQYGIFTPDNSDVFELGPGTYYAKVEFLSDDDSTSTMGSQSINYEVSHKRASVTYGSTETTTQAVQSFIDPSKPQLSDYATLDWYYSSDHASTLVQIINAKNYVVYEKTLDFLLGTCTPPGAPEYVKVSPCKHSFKWDGKVNTNLSFGIPVYNVFNGDLEYYYAKNGKYKIVIKPLDQYSKHAVVHSITVINQATTLTGIIPAPPVKMKKGSSQVAVTASNKGKCIECRNYFYKYVWNKTLQTPQETQYVGWSTSIYGPDGLQRFWKAAELFIYDPNKSAIDNLQNLISIPGMMVPVFDAANSVIYMMRGDEVNAALSAVSIIPFYGDGTMGIKMFRRVYNLAACINCFTAGTTVTTIDGEKPIEEIKIGDQVLSKNPYTGEVAYKGVEQLFEREVSSTWNITAGKEVISTTAEHPFWIVGKGWTLTKDLKAGDQFETYDGSKLYVEKVEISNNKSKVYNFSVADYHTYYISNLKILSHNTACLTPADYIAKKVSQYTSRLTEGTSGTILDRELIAAGISKPDVPEVSSWAAHHIIAKNINGNPDIEIAQAILAKYDIDINSAANGVWLPKLKGESGVLIDGTMVSTHNGYHVGDYFEYVREMLEEVQDDRDKVLLAIEQIRSDLLTNKIKLGNIDS
ncbi:S8 family serine peptidase [Paenibacillus sp. CF384]|uniref:S8 family serine peptidase n=1 Tax=Paenibacillus sp. CF384 TaxID=1884382 RepID=UPI00089834EE|nr:S8 family serine peptidase [Paenibacillus sp. CF384]SDX72233.1 intein C-terminal splicing region [Paenibacillus sp. CF384]